MLLRMPESLTGKTQSTSLGPFYFASATYRTADRTSFCEIVVFGRGQSIPLQKTPKSKVAMRFFFLTGVTSIYHAFHLRLETSDDGPSGQSAYQTYAPSIQTLLS